LSDPKFGEVIVPDVPLAWPPQAKIYRQQECGSFKMLPFVIKKQLAD